MRQDQDGYRADAERSAGENLQWVHEGGSGPYAHGAPGADGFSGPESRQGNAFSAGQPMPPGGVYGFHPQPQYWKDPYGKYSYPPGNGWQPAGKQKSGATKAIVITVAAIVLIIASAYVFMGTADLELPSLGLPPMPTYYDFEGDFGFDEPGDYIPPAVPTAPLGAGVTMNLSPLPPGGELDIREIYRRCSPSVIAIMAHLDDESYYWGTGIVLSEDGHIITNSHVLEGAAWVTVTLHDNREYEARLVGADTQSDLAVLKINAQGLTAAEFGDSSQLQVGDGVVAIGNPLGMELRGTLTDGIVSAINRDIDFNGHSLTLLQTNAAINEGNSGGPLINMYGQVIGVTNMKMISYYNSIEGIGFAIPTSVIKDVVDQLIKQGHISGRPAIGITTDVMPPEYENNQEIPDGVYIESVHENSDAYKKGVRQGDILLAVEGEPVESVSDVNRIKNDFGTGESLTLTLYRQGRTFDVVIVLQDMYELYG